MRRLVAGLPPLTRRIVYGLVVLAATSIPAAGQDRPAACEGSQVDRLEATRSWRADLPVQTEQGAAVRCLAVVLAEGEVLRGVAQMDVEPPWSGVRIQMYRPGAESAAAEYYLGNISRTALTIQAVETGTHHVVVRDAWSVAPYPGASRAGSVPVRVWVEQVEPPALAAARQEALRTDPRVAWLREHAWTIRSIDPLDHDFADLDPLREVLDGVRVVLLGEADHRSGTDFRAKSRLVKFLHRELGFDVLAFESPMYDMTVAWNRIRAGMPPRESFALGSLHFWGRASEMRPLVDYIGEHARGGTPLDIAGFDNQPQQASIRFFMDDLSGFLAARNVAGPLAAGDTPEWRALEALSQVRYRTGRAPPPDPATRRALLAALDHTLETIDDMEDEEARVWRQILRGMRCHARRILTHEGIGYCNRNDQMAENLLWLADERYPGRKIIVWSGTIHAARLPDVPPAGGTGASLGYRIGEELAAQSYVIGVTSHGSTGGHISQNQHPLPDFEELMTAAGFEYGLLDMRRETVAGSWVRDEFRARALTQTTEAAVWSDVMDALLFVRQHFPSTPVRQAP